MGQPREAGPEAGPHFGDACPAPGTEQTTDILAWLLVGVIAGVLAKLLMAGPGPEGIIVTILLGIAGAIVGGSIAVALGMSDGVNNFDVGTIVLAVGGAMLVLFGYRTVSGAAPA